MIIMVGLSVVATVAVVKVSDKSQEPIPAWIEIVVLKFLSRIVCLHKMAKQLQHSSEKVVNVEDKGDNTLKDYTGNGIDSKRFHESMLISLSDITMRQKRREKHDKTTNCTTVSLAEKWKVIAIIASRCFALLFTVIMVTCTATILIYIKVMSEIEFANALGEDRDKWLSET